MNKNELVGMLDRAAARLAVARKMAVRAAQSKREAERAFEAIRARGLLDGFANGFIVGTNETTRKLAMERWIADNLKTNMDEVEANIVLLDEARAELAEAEDNWVLTRLIVAIELSPSGSHVSEIEPPVS